ncbi:MAG TPA: hypothetical protein VHS09_11525, partial [Polyangiaceae bacterium]|nr:hypothetical protein [Polyangiaceae bacterium]
MDPTAEALSRLRRFAGAVNRELPPVDVALGEVRKLLRDAGVPFRIVGGVAVLHHGYARTTEDIDVLVPTGAGPRIDAALTVHGFERTSAARLRHVASDVRVDVLVAGEPLPRGDGVYPSPESLGASSRDPEVVDLAGLVALKLAARRHRDLADVVELLKRLDEAHYTALEAAVERPLRPELT